MSEEMSEAQEVVEQEPIIKESAKKFERAYKAEQWFDHDLFELSVENIVKDHGYNSQNPIYRSYPHKHFFHSFDSNGKKQFFCSYSSGHTHKCEVYEDEDGSLKLHVGPAIQKQGSKYVPYKVEHKAENSTNRDGGEHGIRVHSHDAKYVISERVKVRKKVDKAQEIIAQRSR